MIKVTIEADNNLELEGRLRRAINADRYLTALNEVANEVFRPARKHGYEDEKISALLNRIDAVEVDGADNLGSKLIGLLEEKYYSIIGENEVHLDE